MINPHWSLVDLDPHTWNSIGRFFEPSQYIRAAQPGQHGLFVLHDGGRVMRVVDTAMGVRRDLQMGEVGDPHETAARLYATGEWQRVHIIDKRHLAHVAREAQAGPRRELTLDQYYHLVYNLIWDGSGGYVSVPPHPGHWNGWTYTAIRDFVGGLPDPSTVALVVVEDGETEIGLILDVRNKLIESVTTLETFGLPAPVFDVSAGSMDWLWSLLESRSKDRNRPKPAAALLCSKSVFDRWIEEPDNEAKWRLLEQATEQQQAFLRISA